MPAIELSSTLDNFSFVILSTILWIKLRLLAAKKVVEVDFAEGLVVAYDVVARCFCYSVRENQSNLLPILLKGQAVVSNGAMEQGSSSKDTSSAAF